MQQLPTAALLKLADIQDLIAEGNKQEALAKLYRLASVYPDSQEIQGLIKQNLSTGELKTPVRIAPPPQPLPAVQYQSPQPPQYSQRPPQPSLTISFTKPKDNLLYAIIGAVGLVMAASVFLPWASASSGIFEININGLAQYSGNGAGLVKNKPTTVGDGIFVIGAVLFILFFSVMGYLKPQQSRFAVALIVLGVISFGILMWKFIAFSDVLTAGASIGFGLMLGIFSAIVIIALAVILRFNPKK